MPKHLQLSDPKANVPPKEGTSGGTHLWGHTEEQHPPRTASCEPAALTTER